MIAAKKKEKRSPGHFFREDRIIGIHAFINDHDPLAYLKREYNGQTATDKIEQRKNVGNLFHMNHGPNQLKDLLNFFLMSKYRLQQLIYISNMPSTNIKKFKEA